MTTRRDVLAAMAAASAGTALGSTLGAQLAFAQTAPGKPHAGKTLNALMPVASQFRAQEKRLAQFEERTGIKVTYTYTPYGQLRDKITTEGVGGSRAFDIICYQDSWGPSIAQFLHPINDMLSKDGISMDRYPQAYAQGSGFDGKIYGLPIRGHPQLLFYRKDLFDAAGLQPPKTWDEVVSAGRAIQEKNPNVAGLAMYYGKGNGAQNLFLWLNHLWGRGGDIFADNFARTRFNEPAAVEATQQYLDYLLKHKVAAPGSVQFVEADAVNSVSQGNSAMVMVWWWVYATLTGAQSRLKPEQVGFAPMPQMPGGRPVSYAISLPYAISANSGQKEAAFEFLKWVGSPELEVDIASDKSDPNTADIVVTHTASFANERVNAANNGLHRVAARSLEGSRIMPQLREWPQIASVLENTISELATGAKPVKAGLDDAAAEVDRLLRRAGYRR